MAGKWISVESPDIPAADFATNVLNVRMQSVVETLPKAAQDFSQDIEHVHQLRVGCRRADAALKAFRPLMSGKPKKLRSWLRQIRQAAGPARDADVLMVRLVEEAKENSADVNLQYVIERLKRYRTNAQGALVEVEEKSRKGALEESFERCLSLLQQDKVLQEHKTIGQFARWALREACQGMFQLSGLSEPTIPQLHELRIAGKRLRYSIELFSGAFPPALRREVYPLVEKIQDRLGSLNDHATTQALFQRWLASLATDSRAAYLAHRIVQEHDAALAIRNSFLEWWTPKRVAQLESYLAELMDTSS